MRPLLPAELDATRPVYMLDLSWGGMVHRIASEPCTVTMRDGTKARYQGGLRPPQFSETLQRDDLDPGKAYATIECAIDGVDVAARHRSGHRLLSATGTLTLGCIREADALLGTPAVLQSEAQRWWMLTGRLRSPEYASPDQAAGWFRATLRQEPWERSRPIIETLARIDATAWPISDAEVHGKVIPIIIGRPGVYRDAGGVLQSAAGSPAYVVARDGPGRATRILIAQHEVAATSVTVIDEDGTTEVFAVEHVTDSRGFRRASVDATSAGSIDRFDSQFWVAWTDGGGLHDPMNGGELSNAVAVALWALQRAGEDVDVSRWRAAQDVLPVIDVATYINDSTTAWEWIREGILPLLPVAIQRGQQGLYPIVTDAHIRTDRVAADVTIVAGTDVARDWSPVGEVSVETDPEDLHAEIHVRCAYDGVTGEALRTVSLLPEAGGTEPDVGASAYLDVAVRRYGASTVEPVEARLLWAPAAAGVAAVLLARLRTLPYESLEGDAPWFWGWLTLGRTVSLTYAAAARKRAVALVTGRSIVSGRWRFELTLSDDPVRDARHLTA